MLQELSQYLSSKLHKNELLAMPIVVLKCPCPPHKFAYYFIAYSFVSIMLWPQGEGCSFRGRLLMQLSVKNGVYPTPDEYVRGIDNDDIYASQHSLRRRKYRIFVGFLEAAIIYPVDGPIEFEVSIGKSGFI